MISIFDTHVSYYTYILSLINIIKSFSCNKCFITYILVLVRTITAETHNSLHVLFILSLNQLPLPDPTPGYGTRRQAELCLTWTWTYLDKCCLSKQSIIRQPTAYSPPQTAGSALLCAALLKLLRFIPLLCI